MSGAITHLIAGVPVSDLGAATDWYTRFFGREPDLNVGDEILWDVDEHAPLFIGVGRTRTGSGRITFIVKGLDVLLERLADNGIKHRRIETYTGGRAARDDSRSGWQRTRLRRSAGDRVNRSGNQTPRQLTPSAETYMPDETKQQGLVGKRLKKTCEIHAVPSPG